MNRRMPWLLGVLCFLGTTSLWSEEAWKSGMPDITEKPVFSHETSRGWEITLPSENSLGWWSRTESVTPEKSYAFSAVADWRSTKKQSPGNDLMIVLTWRLENGKMFQRDYVEFEDADGIRTFQQTFTAPPNCTEVEWQCLFKWQPGTIFFRGMKMAETEPVAPRKVRLVAANAFQTSPNTIEGNLQQIEKTLQKIQRSVEKPDLILFSECVTDSGTPGSLRERAEPLDGPTFQKMSVYAKAMRTWIVGNIHEITPEGTLHNTAILIDRDGKLHGIYRKVHITISEANDGVIPGREFPVFTLDFGKVGIAICWDNWFSETAKHLRRQGAELLLFPLAGDGVKSHWEKVWPARTIDTGIPMVISTRQHHLASGIIDRDGEWLAETLEENGFAAVELDLNQRKRIFWLSVGPALGDPYQLYLLESRAGTRGLEE